MKIIMSEMKHALNEINGRLAHINKKTCEPEDIVIDPVQI